MSSRFAVLDDFVNLEARVDFGAIEFGRAGTYEYALREVAGDLPGVSYDGAVHSMTVVVTDDGEGTLHTEVSFDGKQETPVFVNKYVKPEAPKDSGNPGTSLAKTGDATFVVAGALAIIAVVAAVVVLVVRRKGAIG